VRVEARWRPNVRRLDDCRLKAGHHIRDNLIHGVSAVGLVLGDQASLQVAVAVVFLAAKQVKREAARGAILELRPAAGAMHRLRNPAVGYHDALAKAADHAQVLAEKAAPVSVKARARGMRQSTDAMRDGTETPSNCELLTWKPGAISKLPLSPDFIQNTNLPSSAGRPAGA